MNPDPTVSVCMVTYNQEAFIDEAIRGVLMQKECIFELVIADDHSTDGTLAICKRYQEEYPGVIRIIEQKENKGVVGNTKDCLLACKGKYIAVCEGDDYWIDEYKLKKQAAVLDQHPDVSLVHTSWVNFIQSTGEMRDRLLTEEDSICVRQGGQQSVAEIMAMHYYGIRLSSVCFRGDILREACEKDPDMFSAHFSTCDIGLFYVMAYHGRLWRMLEKTLVYRMQDESVSMTSNRERAVRYTLGCLYIKVHFARRYRIHHKVMQPILRPTFYLLCDYAFRCHDRNLLREVRSLAREIKYKPSLGQRVKMMLT